MWTLDPKSGICSFPGTIMIPDWSQKGTTAVIPWHLHFGSREQESTQHEWDGPLDAKDTSQRLDYFVRASMTWSWYTENLTCLVLCV